MTGSAATLGMLTNAFVAELGLPVLDRTGLTGAFDLKLKWSPRRGSSGRSVERARVP